MIITNVKKPDNAIVKFATQIITDLQAELPQYIANGHGPFLAAVYMGDKLISKCANTVVMDNCSNNHAEVNAIRAAQEYFGTYDLSPYNLTLYSTSEPCMMCVGAIMWSGIKTVVYGVQTTKVESITGFDEGFKSNWMNEFKKRGIAVYGNIKPLSGEKVLKTYMREQRTVYKPTK